MQIIDTHCDALYKLQRAKKTSSLMSFKDAKQLQTNLNNLKKGNVRLQFFAIFLDPDIPSDQMWTDALEQIELFHTEIVRKHDEIIHITKWEQIDHLHEEQIGAILTLEGAEPFGNDLTKLHQLYDQHILSIGLTWNYANLCADGVEESRGAGLTILGKEVVKQNNTHRVMTDVSHLSIQGFWDVMEFAHFPFASHSNARSICNHPRNLTDEQLKCLIQHHAPIHLVFYPAFIKSDLHQVSINHLIEHIDYICSLGGVTNIGFGSDFDGIDRYVIGLEDASSYQNLIHELLKHYSEEEVRGFAYNNFNNYRKKYLNK